MRTPISFSKTPVVPLLVVLAIGHARLIAAPWVTFSEISYRPPGDETLEFVEVYNLEAPHVDLGGWKLDGQVEFEFPRGVRLAPRTSIVVARDLTAFRRRYPAVHNVVGPYRGDLDNGGGRLRLRNRTGAVAAEMRYGSHGAWTAVPDGTGHTLVLTDPFFDAREPGSWRPSRAPGGTPGVYAQPIDGGRASADPGRPTGDARLNEVALRRQTTRVELVWIEFYNSAPVPDDFSDYFLSDDRSRLTKWKIPEGTTVPAEGFSVLPAERLGAEVLAGPVIFLTHPDGRRVVDALSLRDADGTQVSGRVSYGRTPDGAERVRRLARDTHGAPNELTTGHDVVINEISYHPAGGDAADEYIELHNRGASVISLNGLRLARGVRYDFRAGDTIRPGGFLVVARSPEALAAKHGIASKQIVGPFEGQLSNRGEELWLCDRFGRTVDLVSYADRSPWPALADGWGSSLELVDPRVDNALAGAWVASNESPKAEWQHVRYEGHVYLFNGMRASSFQFMLLDAGECLVDDLRVSDRSGRTVIDEDFDGETNEWRAFGTHLESGVVRDSRLSMSPCYRIVATGRGNPRHNYVSLSLERPLDEGAEYSVSFRVRWQNGCARLLSRTSGQGLAKTHRLRLPELRGTPGRANSRAAAATPIVGAPRQYPITPKRGESVRFEVPISARTEIEHVELRYRPESETKWRAVTLRKRNTPTWTATIPSLPRGRVEFAIFARDADGREGAFPRGGTERPALFAVDLATPSRLPTYHVLVSDREWEASRRRQRMSNRLMDATLVYGTSRIFYNVGFRLRGSGFTRGDGNWRLVFGAETLDGRHALTFDSQGRDYAKMNERTTFWLLDEVDVPTPRQRYVYLNVHGPGQESGVYEEVEKINGDFLERWFPREGAASQQEGLLHKVDDYWDFGPPEDRAFDYRDRRGRRFGGFGRRGGTYAEAYMSYQTSDPEDYRWNFTPRANGTDEDFGPLIELLKTVDPEITLDVVFRERIEKLVDVDEWTRVLAARTVANDWDSYGLRRGKNAYLYRSPSGRWHLLPWDSDLSWRSRGFGRYSRSTSLFSDKFPAVERLLRQPRYRRLFLGHVAFLAEKSLEPKYFSRIVEELEKHVGVPAYDLEDSAASIRERILAEIPEVEFRVDSVVRVAREGKPDLLRVSGRAPLTTHALRLGGQAGRCRFPDERAWTAEFEVGPEGGRVVLQAIDRDGDEVARGTITVPARRHTAE